MGNTLHMRAMGNSEGKLPLWTTLFTKSSCVAHCPHQVRLTYCIVLSATVKEKYLLVIPSLSYIEHNEVIREVSESRISTGTFYDNIYLLLYPIYN
jgi:hypothetical protein